MIKRLIQIPTNDSKIYQQILAILNFIIDATDQERQVLSEIIRLNNEYSALDEPRRAKFILSTDMRKEMRDNLNIQEKQFNSLLSRLKKKELFGKPFISNEGFLHPELVINPDEEGYELIIRIQKEPLNSTTEEDINEVKIPKNPKGKKKESSNKGAKISEETKIAKLANEEEVVKSSIEGDITIL